MNKYFVVQQICFTTAALLITSSTALASEQGSPQNQPNGAGKSVSCKDLNQQFESAKQDFLRQQATERSLLSDPKHQSQLCDHGKSTEYVMVVTHGYMDSANYMTGIRDAACKQGITVLSITLPGHWNKDLKSLDKVKFDEWVQAEENAIKLAKRMGQKVLLAGYSLGGLLAIKHTLNDPNIAALLLWAPAIRVSTKSRIALGLGTASSKIGIPARKFVGLKKPDGKNIPYLSTKAGYQVNALTHQVWEDEGLTKDPFDDKNKFRRQQTYSRLNMPVFLAEASTEKLVSNDELAVFASSLHNPKNKHIVYSGTKHETLTKTLNTEPNEDPAKYLYKANEFNPHSSEMLDSMRSFLKSLGSSGHACES